MTAKIFFEQFAAEHGIEILHYHCDNGRFYINAFSKVCHNARQKLTFCGVNAHFQNDIAERAICDLSGRVCKQLIHACACWPEAVHFCLVAVLIAQRPAPPQQPTSDRG